MSSSWSRRIERAGEGKGKLTREIIPTASHFGYPLRMRVVSSARFADGFVARCHEHDGKEAEDQRAGAVNVPAFKDDAEVCGVPREQHLRQTYQRL